MSGVIDSDVLELNDEVEARPLPGKGNALFARVALAAGWTLRDHPVCVADAASRRLPRLDNVDELMQTLAEEAAAGNVQYGQLLSGCWRMSFLDRHLEMQDTTDAELPEWAVNLGWTANEYNVLAAQLQSNVARHHDGEQDQGARASVILLPRLHLCNHACGSAANVELGWEPLGGPPAPVVGSGGGDCPCGVGHYVLIARRAIAEGEELCFSYIGSHVLCERDDMEERRTVLKQRWGFDCQCPLCTEHQAQPAM